MVDVSQQVLRRLIGIRSAGGGIKFTPEMGVVRKTEEFVAVLAMRGEGLTNARATAESAE